MKGEGKVINRKYGMIGVGVGSVMRTRLGGLYHNYHGDLKTRLRMRLMV